MEKNHSREAAAPPVSALGGPCHDHRKVRLKDRQMERGHFLPEVIWKEEEVGYRYGAGAGELLPPALPQSV